MMHCIDLTIGVSLHVRKHKILIVIRNHFAAMGEHDQVFLTMCNNGVEVCSHYAVSQVKDSSMNISTTGWSEFITAALLKFRAIVKIEVFHEEYLIRSTSVYFYNVNAMIGGNIPPPP